MDEQLLKQMDEKDFIWLASAISVKGLEDVFLNRFSAKIKTEPNHECIRRMAGRTLPGLADPL